MTNQAMLPSALERKKQVMLQDPSSPAPDPEPKAGDSQKLSKKFYVKDDAASDDPPAATADLKMVTDPPTTLSDPNDMTPEEQVVYWRGEAERNEQRWKSFRGQWGNKAEKYEDRIGALEKRLDQGSKPVEKPSKPTYDVDITSEERETFKQSADFIKKIAVQVANQAVSHMLERVESLEAKLSGLGTTLGEVKESSAASSGASFNISVRTAIPDLDALTNHAAWRPYAARVVPVTGKQLGQHLVEAYDTGNLESIRNIMDDFRVAVAADGKTDTLENLAVPNAGNGAPARNTGGKTNAAKRLKFSMRKQASDDFRKGRIPIADFAKIKLAFKEAEAKNLVDYDS